MSGPETGDWRAQLRAQCRAQLDVERCRPDRDGALHRFLRRSWHVVDPHPLVDARYLRVLCDALQAVGASRQEGAEPAKDLLINIPPKHTKSLLVSVLYPAWVWTWRPEHRFMATSFAEDNVARDARLCRRLVESEWYQLRWPHVTLQSDSSAVHYYETTAGGFRASRTVRGKHTGKHADDIIVDDPQDPGKLGLADASEASVEAATARHLWDTVLPSRRLDVRYSRRIVVMQRVSDLDLSQHILDHERDRFKHVMLPLMYDPERACDVDWREKEGELLAPRMYDDARQVYGNATEATIAAQYQQDPTAAGAGLFAWDDWRWYSTPTDLPVDGTVLVSIDGATAGRAKTRSARAEEERSRWALTAWLWSEGTLYLLAVDAFRADFADVMLRIESFAARVDGMARDGSRARPRRWHMGTMLIERRSTGEAAASMLKHADLRGLTIDLWDVGSGKVERATAALPIIRGGRVYLPQSLAEAQTGPERIAREELRQFPRGKSDDIVDTLSQVVLWTQQHTTDDALPTPAAVSSFASRVFGRR